ncbi:MAG: protein kinase [Pirellulales bacterium]
MAPISAGNATAVGGLAPAVIVNSNSENTRHNDFPTGTSRYEILEELDRGGCGLILRAFDRQLRREVVIKRMLPESAQVANAEQRFLHEAVITGRLAHPGIVPVYEVGIDDATRLPFYAMKHLQGRTLAEQLDILSTDIKKPSVRRELLERFHHVCLTLAFAHEHAIIHRDLKPANILLGEFDETVVLDWGLAKQLDKLPDSETERTEEAQGTSLNVLSDAKWKAADCGLTINGLVMGTAAYMSPEQARGDTSEVDYRSDVFSLGAILYELLSGERPFQAATTQMTMARVMTAAHRPLRQVDPTIPRAAAAVCAKALAADRKDRYADASELAADIHRFLSGEAVSAQTEPWWAKLDRLASKYRTLFWSVLLSVTLVAACAIIAFVTVSRSQRSESAARILAEREHQAKTDALAAEEAAHQEALTLLESAREAVDSWVLEVSDDLQCYPGLGQLRAHLLKRAEEHYVTLASADHQTPLMQLESARAHVRLGDLQRLTGRGKDAVDSYQTASKLLRLLIHGQDDWRDAAAVCYAAAQIGWADCSIDLRDTPSAEQLLQEAVTACKSVPHDSTEHAAAGRMLAAAGQSQARLHRSQGDLSAAIHAIEQAIADLSHVDSELTAPSMLKRLVELYRDSAEYRAHVGDSAGAADAYDRVIESYSTLLRRFGDRPDWLDARAAARHRLGACNIEQVESDEAIGAFEAAEEDLSLARDLNSGENKFRERLAEVHADLGLAYLQSSEAEKAEEVLRRALNSLHHLSRENGKADAYAVRSAQIMLWLVMAVEQSRTQESQELLNNVAKLIELLSGNETRAESLPLLRAQHWWLSARRHARQADWKQVVHFCKQGLAQTEDTESGTVDQRSMLLLVRGRIAAVQARALDQLGQTDEARSARSIASQAWEACRALDSRRTTVQSVMSQIEMTVESPDADDAEAAKLLALAKLLVQQHETLPTAWRWLSEAALRLDHFELARTAIAKAKRLRRHTALDDELIDGIIRLSSGDIDPAGTEKIQAALAHPRPGDLHSEYLYDRLQKLAEEAHRSNTSDRSSEE